MKLGTRWLWVLWIAATVGWHQAGAASLTAHLSATPQWDIAQTATPPPAAEFTLQGTDTPEDKSLLKRTTAPAALIEHFAELKTPGLIVLGTIRNDLRSGISTTRIERRSIRGPPVAV